MNQSGLPTPPPGHTTSNANPASSSTVAGQSSNDASLASIVATITSTSNPFHLNQYLRNCASREIREALLSSILPGSQDPLNLLNARNNTLGMLYILSARLHTVASDKPLWNYVESFCRDFVPEHARLAPDRVTILATGIRQFAEAEGNLKLAITPLSDLLAKYPPTLSHLTTIHPIFLMTCVATRHFTAAIPVLSHPITTIDLSLSDLSYHDNLLHHYAGGMALAALKKWQGAEELLEICASSPGSAASAIQLEALKKLVLVQLIHHGKTSPPPKYMHPNLMRSFKSSPYANFVNAYPLQRDQLRAIVENEQQLFLNERTLGLITQALDRAPRWAIKKLTTTYLTLHLSDIGRRVGIANENEVKSLILSMIESSEISAEISVDGTVSFSDLPVKFDKAEVDRVLEQAQQQDGLLMRLEKEMERNKEYLTKAVKSKEDAAWGPAMDEDGAFGERPSGNWADEMSFT
ncbi:hypothetical protein K503DRAFT_773077 [Rhizopogon vinicolor AM-OR11-026]|uniref:COP9 signalosome complex subunit 3 n=1 Tax=Rhizopogon vinicolor AM-OR11-026 TaxID=1314800 RepID=A0A1B7MTA5_9AGAM|nr:hypothetical protein K503DRAFT_773077 [Rhizopogon vinicolor AM-OR11-026]